MGAEMQAKLARALTSMLPGEEQQDELGKVCAWLHENRAAAPLCIFVETVEQAPVAISITDASANIIYVNAAFTRVTGYLPEECLGRNESMLSDKRTPPQVYQDLWRTLLARKSWRGTLINRHKNGQCYLAELTIAPMLEEDGSVSHYIGMHRDVTTVYGLEQKVKNQKALIETVVDSIPVAAVLLDDVDQVVLDNQRYKAMASDLGLREPVRDFLRLLRVEMGPEWDRLRDQRRGFQHRELRYDLGGGRPARWFSCAGNWFEEGDVAVDAYFNQRRKRYLLLALTEITQQKRQQEEIRLSALRVLTAEEEKVQSLRETLSAAIHHVQGPMNQLAAAAGLLARRGDAGSTALADTLQQVVDTSRQTIETLQRCMPEPLGRGRTAVNLNQLVHEAILLTRDRLLASGVVVDWRPAPVLPSFVGDENRLRSVFKQLIENAVDAMNDAHVVNRELRLVTWQEGDLLHATVADTGPGIPEALQIKVFEPFYTTKGATGRQAGMGLAVVQDVVARHDGLIVIDPEYRDGCRFHLQFPLSRD